MLSNFPYPDPESPGQSISAFAWVDSILVTAAGDLVIQLVFARSAAGAAARVAIPGAAMAIRGGQAIPSPVAPAGGVVCPTLAEMTGDPTPLTLAADPAFLQVWLALVSVLYQKIAPAFPGATVA